MSWDVLSEVLAQPQKFAIAAFTDEVAMAHLRYLVKCARVNRLYVRVFTEVGYSCTT